MIKAGYVNEDVKESKDMLDVIRKDLNKCANAICRDIEAVRLISRHNGELFRSMNYDFDESVYPTVSAPTSKLNPIFNLSGKYTSS